MKHVLADNFAAHSPRLVPRRTPATALLIHGGVACFWVWFVANAFFLRGLFAWSTGLAYVCYDTILLLFVSWQTRSLLKPAAAPITPPRRLSLGIIVAAHNEATVLPVTLKALLEQSDTPDQIIIADDGSSDATSTVLTEQFALPATSIGSISEPSAQHGNLRWLRLPHGGKARALNAAILALDTDIVLTIDADTLVDTDAMAAIRRAFAAEERLVAASGILIPVCGDTVRGRLFQWFQTYEYVRNFISRFAWSRADSLLLISGAFAAFDRKALVTVGGFDPESMVEDYELIHRLQRYGKDHGLGWKVRIIEGARARTDAPSTLPAFLRQRRRWFAGFLQTQYWNRDMTGNRRYGRLGLWMLPVKAVDTLQPIYGLAAFALLIAFIVRRSLPIVVWVLWVMGIKILIDLLFHLWSLRLYRRWTGTRHQTNLFYAILATLVEPFSFQLLRHTGAALGWSHFLTGRRHWGTQRRAGLIAVQDRAAG